MNHAGRLSRGFFIMTVETSSSPITLSSFESWLKQSHPEISFHSAEAVLRLTEEGATLPFIARYRKEQTGNLDEVKIQAVLDQKEKWELLLHRQKFIIEQIDQQKKLTPELKQTILNTFQMDKLDDIYLPYKQKRKSKAAHAREAGIEPLADWIWNCAHGTETPQPGQTLDIWAFTFHNEKAGFPDAASTIEGAQNILIERLSETQELRQLVRTSLMERGAVKTTKGEKAKANSKFELYFNHEEPISSLLQPQNSHRYLAIRRGWVEEELVMNLGGPSTEPDFDQKLLSSFESAAASQEGSPGHEVLMKAARLALKAHVLPSIENEAHKALKEVADDVAIRVFSENVRKLLLGSPLGSKTVLGVDPGIRTGCKMALIDDSGKYLASSVMHLQSDADKTKAKTMLSELFKNTTLHAIAVGNGTAGRETESFIRALVKELGLNIPVVMVSESGASVYSASEVAREEFPDLDVTVRGAISIARRLQDPLAELVKVDPKSIGVGQYQHDVSQPALKRSLDLVVDSCVNSVGVDLNTASYHLLAHVSGIGHALAKSVVEHRESKGLFHSRQQLLEISRFSKKAFEQAAGFLRIQNSENPLDNTGVHPERYEALSSLAKRIGKGLSDLIGKGVELVRKDEELKRELGAFTFEDVIKELEKPGRDPRDPFVPFAFRDDIFEVKDLKPGMICPGIVTNVTNFGAFIDIGVHQDGLAHLSQLSNKFIKDPREAVSPGDQVKVRVLEVNFEKNQISLTIKGAQEAPARAERNNDTRKEPRKDSKTDSRRAKAPPAPAPAPKPSGAPSPVKPMLPNQRNNTRPNPQRAPQPVFKNNPFAALASIRKDLKTK